MEYPNNNKQMNSSNSNNSSPDLPIKQKLWKVYLVFGIIAIGMMAVLGKLFKIQIVDAEYYQNKSHKQHESKVLLNAYRGNIYDRNGLLIASSVARYSFAIDPTLLKDKHDIDSIAIAIAETANIDKQTIIDKIKSHKGSFLWLIRNASDNTSNRLLKYSGKRGFIVREVPGRNYAFADAASQIVGCTDVDNKGLTGIELSLDSTLKGKDGYAVMNKDARGRLRPLADMPKVDPIHGNSIQLTIDIVLQRIVEFELKQGVQNSGAESGTIVAVDPATGEILAMASYPNFDPNDLTTLDNSRLRNRSITDLYEPGSTFKMITAAAGIEEGVIHPEDIVDGMNGAMPFKDFTIIDDHPIGKVSFKEAFAKSSNIVLSTLAYNIPVTKFYKYIRDFGFGISTGIEIPGEISGRLKSIEQFDASARRFAGYGYGIAVTPLQLAMAYAAIANNGVLNKAYIVKNIFNTEGKAILENKPQKIRNIVSELTAQKVKELLVNVVDNGTGINAKIPGIKIAGKTGTAQQLVNGSYKEKKYTASFAGFFPADNPKLAMVVILDKPLNNYYGGSVAAPIFRNIAQRWISMLPNILLNDANKPFVHSDSVKVPNLKGLNYGAAAKILKIYGLKSASPDTSSNKVVIRQDPAPGSFVYKNTSIYFGSTLASDSLVIANPKLAASLRPNVVGMTARRAINILHKNKIVVNMKGRGRVIEQKWTGTNNNPVCTLFCK